MGRQRGVTLDDIVDTAAEIADAQGLENLSLGKIAAELGIRSPSLYNHVDGLRGIHLALALRGAAELSERLAEARGDRTGEDAIRVMAFAFRRFASEHPGHYGALATGTSLTQDEPTRQAIRAPLQVVADALGELGVEGSDIIHAARFFRSTVHGFVTLERSEAFTLPESPDETFSRAVDFFVAAMRATGAGTA